MPRAKKDPALHPGAPHDFVGQQVQGNGSGRAEDHVFTGTGPNVTNVVCGVHLNCLFDLALISKHARNSYYRPKRFPAVVMRLREPKATALVFEKGRMQVLGTRSVEDAQLAARKFARMLQKMGFEPRLTDFAVQNIVANADTKMVIRLEGLRLACLEFAHYEPEQFPGLLFRLAKPKMTMLIFAKGKVIFLGAKKVEEIDEALKTIWPLLKKYKRD